VAAPVRLIGIKKSGIKKGVIAEQKARY